MTETPSSSAPGSSASTMKPGTSTNEENSSREIKFVPGNSGTSNSNNSNSGGNNNNNNNLTFENPLGMQVEDEREYNSSSFV